METRYISKIAELNDAFRCGGFGVTMTIGVQGLTNVPALLRAVREFNTFTEDNDPYQEHDFGSLEWDGQKVFWKIDYYDRTLKFGEQPLSRNCRRVLTVMLANEY
jgi:hypothetical protein